MHCLCYQKLHFLGKLFADFKCKHHLGQFSSRQDQAQHQLAPVTPVHVQERGEENEEEQREKAAIRESGTPVPGGRNEGFPAGSVFDTFMTSSLFCLYKLLKKLLPTSTGTFL